MRFVSSGSSATALSKAGWPEALIGHAVRDSDSGENHALSEELLNRCRERALGYDAENRFFSEDFEELKKAGYTKINVPKEFGGLGP